MSLVKRNVLLLLALFCLSFSLFALDIQPVITSPQIQTEQTVQNVKYTSSYVDQLGGLSLVEENASQLRLLRAFSSPDYPVIAGDQYSLSYFENGKVVNFSIVVPYSKIINLGAFGSIDASDMTYLELKRSVENKVSNLYKFSNPQFTITNTGIFPVTVKGEVVKTTVVDAWGLAKLSDVIALALDTASTRSVKVVSSNGDVKTYDLYRGVMEGDESQNPTLQPGDQVVFLPKTKMVELTGFVNRPGFYQVEDNENLLSIINRYAKGFSSSASLANVTVLRNNGTEIESNEINLNTKALYFVEDGDKIVVKPNLVDYPSISLEGALRAGETSANYIQGAYSSKYFYKFMPGETIANMAESISSLFTSFSDLKEAVLIRDGVEEKLNLEAILYQNDEKGKELLQPGDKIYIPFAQMLVTVNGAVNKAGNFGYVPGKTLSYYINLAGGLSNNAKGMDKVKVFDKFGDEIDKNGVIPSESTIEVPQSTFATSIAPVVTVVSLVGTFVSIALNIAYLVNAAK